MMSAASYNTSLHQIYLVDYLLIYLTDQTKLISNLKKLDNNKTNGYVRIGLSDPDEWKDFNFKMIKESLKSILVLIQTLK